MGPWRQRHIECKADFFAEFLAATDVYDSWVNSCPLSYSSPNAHSPRDVLGALLLATLAGYNRYAPITGLRGDAVSPRILGMQKIISEDTLRRALARMKAEQRQSRLALQLLGSVQAASSTPWIMDIDTPDKDGPAWVSAVLVTNSAYALEVCGQLYRDRAHCENGFDELKNQWGWGGFTTQDMERCQASARAVALVYNWWSWNCRAAKPDVRMKAITSRALLLAGVGQAVKHAGQTTMYLTPMHAAKDKLIALIANIRVALSHVRAVADQLPLANRWKTFMDYVAVKITRPLPLRHPPVRLALVG